MLQSNPCLCTRFCAENRRWDCDRAPAGCCAELHAQAGHGTERVDLSGFTRRRVRAMGEISSPNPFKCVGHLFIGYGHEFDGAMWIGEINPMDSA